MENSTFDVENFLSEYQTKNYFEELTDILSADLANLPQRIQDFREKFNVELTPQEVEPFQFDLANQSYESVPAEAAARGANLKNVTFIMGDRYFLARDFNEGPDQVWDPIAAPNSADVQEEMSNLVFYDPNKTIVDWPSTIANLNRMISSKPYTNEMMHLCLIRMINHFDTKLSEDLKSKNSNQIANFLLSLDAKPDRMAFHKSRLLQSVRCEHESLSSAVLKVKLIVDKIHEISSVQVPQQAAEAAGVQQVAGGQPIVGGQPAAGRQPAAGVQQAAGGHPTAGGQPAAGTAGEQLVAGGQQAAEAAGVQQVAGGQPGAGVQP